MVIWHSLRLTNESTVPWTTAPAMTMKNGALIGQDTLSYTPAGRTVRITRAVDVQGDRAEYEIARERAATTFYGSRYDRVTVRGEIQVTSHKREAIRLEIVKHLQGDVELNPDGAEVVMVAEGLRQVNPKAHLTWTIDLQAGASRTLAYTYSVWVRA